MPKKNTPEANLQMAVVLHLKFLAKPDVVWFHVPNGGKMPARTGAWNKRLGVIPGVPDMVFVIPGRQACFIEFKSPKGRQTDSQKAMEKRLLDIGAGYAVIRDIDAALDCLKEWGAIKAKDPALLRRAA